MKRTSVTQKVRAASIVLGILASAGALGGRVYAQPQAWLPDRAYSEGPGFKVGDLELHPGVAVRAGYNSNVFRTDNTAAYPRTGSGMLTVTPHIFLTTEGKQRASEGEDKGGGQPAIAFTGGASVTYFGYLKEDARPNGVRLGADTQAALTILPGRAVNAMIGAEYVRSIQPFTERLGGDENYAMDTILPSVRLNMGSKSRVFNTYVGYTPRFTIFEKKSAFHYLSTVSHAVQAGSSWRFLPSTALINQNELAIQDYLQDPNADPQSSTYVRNNKMFQSRFGLQGALTRRLSLRALAGYALVKFEDGSPLDSYEGAIGDAVLSYSFGRGSVFDVGYQGTVSTSFIGGWMRLDRGFAALRLALGGVFVLGLEAGAGYAGYGRLVKPTGTPGVVVPMGEDNTTQRNDIRVDGAVRGEYRVTNWLGFMADFTVMGNFTDFKYARSEASAPTRIPPFPAEFVVYQIFGGVRAFY
jgi:hypothetical protein